MQASGTVVEAAGLRKWQVRLDHNKKIVTISTSAIKKIEANVGIPMVSTKIFLFCFCITQIILTKFIIII